MKGEKLVGWKVVLSLSVLSVVLILFATIMKIQLNYLTAEVANLGESLYLIDQNPRAIKTIEIIITRYNLYHTYSDLSDPYVI